MPITTIDSIYTHFRANFKDSPDFALEYYQQNADVLDNVQKFTSVSELKYYTELSWHYINALLTKDHYNDACNEAAKRLHLIDHHIRLYNDRSVKDDWYYGIFFLSGMAAFKLRDFSNAVKIFKQLVIADPTNDLYKKWLSDSLYSIRLRIIHAIWVVSAMLLLFVLFFEEFIPSKEIKLGLTIIGFVGVVWNLCYEFWTKRSFRKKEV